MQNQWVKKTKHISLCTPLNHSTGRIYQNKLAIVANSDWQSRELWNVWKCGTWWESFAAAAASPVSMDATRAPSRAGLSCRGTEGPTRAEKQNKQDICI